MKKLFLFLLLPLALISCDKEKDDESERITGTVKEQQGCFQHSWLVAIDNPDSSEHPFICDEPLAGTAYNCSNAVYIINLPERFAKKDKRITFSVVADQGVSCLSLSVAPHHVEVENVTEAR